MRNRIILLVLLLCTIFVITGCRTREEFAKAPYDAPLPPGRDALRKITDPYLIPDFTIAALDLKDLRKALGNSLNYLNKPSSKQYYPVGQITHNRAVESLKVFAELLDSGLTGTALNHAIREKFDVYMSVGCDDNGTVLFTGYYTPIFDGSTEPTEKFRYPLYKKPEDLLKGPDGEILGRRGMQGQITPYPSRAVIESAGMLKGNELVWLSDPFEVYIAHVQGSAKIRFGDGKLITVGYTASNGHEYNSISKEMIADGVIGKSQLSLAAMIDYFKHNLDKVSKYTRLNPRYVFFRNESAGPRGSLNEPVISMRSIATDKSIFPRGCLTYIETALPVDSGGIISNQVYGGFALDQDTGGAIRAPGRCDVYMGEGDTAGNLAGRTYQEGKLYYLFVKE